MSSTVGNNRTHYPLTVCYCGPLMGGPHCRLSILRNGNVPCRYFLDFPVDFKIVQHRLSILRNGNVPFHYILNFPDDFKRILCRLSNLRNDHLALSYLRVKGHYCVSVRKEPQELVILSLLSDFEGGFPGSL